MQRLRVLEQVMVTSVDLAPDRGPRAEVQQMVSRREIFLEMWRDEQLAGHEDERRDLLKTTKYMIHAAAASAGHCVCTHGT